MVQPPTSAAWKAVMASAYRFSATARPAVSQFQILPVPRFHARGRALLVHGQQLASLRCIAHLGVSGGERRRAIWRVFRNERIKEPMRLVRLFFIPRDDAGATQRGERNSTGRVGGRSQVRDLGETPWRPGRTTQLALDIPPAGSTGPSAETE